MPDAVVDDLLVRIKTYKGIRRILNDENRFKFESCLNLGDLKDLLVGIGGDDLNFEYRGRDFEVYTVSCIPTNATEEVVENIDFVCVFDIKTNKAHAYYRTEKDRQKIERS